LEIVVIADVVAIGHIHTVATCNKVAEIGVITYSNNYMQNIILPASRITLVNNLDTSIVLNRLERQVDSPSNLPTF
jgi:hypothetical protein